jgi:hypothetical protein
MRSLLTFELETNVMKIFCMFYETPTIAPFETGRRRTVAVSACVVPDKE